MTSGSLPYASAELLYRFGVGAQFAYDFVRTRRHNHGIAKNPFGLLFERADIPFPVQAKAQSCVEDSQRIERNRPPLWRYVVGVAAGTVRLYVMAR